jgi:hypothetical protein
MDKLFFSQNNYITLKEIIINSTGISFNNKNKERELYDNMINIFDTTDTDNYHDLNKKCISIYTDRFEKQIPTNNERINNERINNVNIINPVQNSMQNTTLKLTESVPEIDETDTSDLFAKLKKERENNYDAESNSISPAYQIESNTIESNTIQSNTIQQDLEESFQSGYDLNHFQEHNTHTSDFNSDNVMSIRPEYNLNDNQVMDNQVMDNQVMDNEVMDYPVIQNSIDKTGVYNDKTEVIEEDEHIFNTLNPYSLFKEGEQSNKDIELVQREILVMIDSRDRDLEVYPHSTHFQVKFGGRPDSIEIPTHLDSNGVIIHETATLYKGYQGANINMGLKNIKYIQLINVTVPYVPVYYNGNPPVTYTDENQTKDLDGLGSAFLPQFKKGRGSDINNPDPTGSTGIPLDILDEPYLLIDVDEIDTQNWYRSSNPDNDAAFARVMNPSIISSHTNATFAIFSPQSEEEKMKYDPTLLASIDKMTLHIKDQNNSLINVGQDKIHVDKIEKSTGKIINPCFNTDAVDGTDITISLEHSDYNNDGCSNNIITNHALKPGETLYFYDTRPCNNEHIYKLNQLQTSAKYNKGTGVIQITYKYETTTKDNKILMERTLSLSQYLFIGDFISINGQLFKINSFSGKNVVFETMDILRNSNIVTGTYNNIGFVRQNKRGFTSNNPSALNSNKGHKVLYIYENVDVPGTSIKFTINLGWDQIKGYFENDDNNTFYQSNTVFFIKKSLQTSFMFKFSVMEKQSKDLESELI